MVIRNFPRWRPAAILDLVQPEVVPFDPPSPKTLPYYPRIKHEVDWMIRCRDMAIQNFPAAILDLVQPEIAPFDPSTPKTPLQDQTRSRSDAPFRRYGHLKFSKMAASRHLGFGPTGSGSLRSADLENPTLEPNMKWIG